MTPGSMGLCIRHPLRGAQTFRISKQLLALESMIYAQTKMQGMMLVAFRCTFGYLSIQKHVHHKVTVTLANWSAFPGKRPARVAGGHGFRPRSGRWPRAVRDSAASPEPRLGAVASAPPETAFQTAWRSESILMHIGRIGMASIS